MRSSAKRSGGAGLRARLARVQALVCDVDGVMTRGELHYGPEGEWKTFDVQDGHGLVLARQAGLRVAWLTARTSAAVRRRADELKIDLLMDGRPGKRAGLEEISRNFGVPPDRICYVGDDLLDLGAMALAGVPVAVANAVPEVRAAAAWTTKRRGGEGAVREVAERLLRASGRWAEIVRRSREN